MRQGGQSPAQQCVSSCQSLEHQVHTNLRSRIEEQFGVVGRILSLNQAVQLGVFGCLFAEEGVAKSWRLDGKVWRSVFLELTECNSKSDHVGSDGRVGL